MGLDGTLETAFGVATFMIAGAEHVVQLGLDPVEATLTQTAIVGDLLALIGFLLALLATFALAIAHAVRPWRNISIFLNGAALACGCGLIAIKLDLVTVPDDNIVCLRGTAGLCAALAVLVLWPALRGVAARADERAAPSMGANLPLLATPGGPLSLEDALTGSGATLFARNADMTELWTVPRTAAPATPVQERMTASVQASFSQQGLVANQFQTTDAAGHPRWYELTVQSGRFEDGQNGAIGCMLDVTRFRKPETECRHMLQEATHRAKNLLTIIQSVARMSAKTLGLPANAVEPFNARLQAIAMCYDLLVREGWEAVPLTDLLHSQLNHTLGNAAARASWTGPALRLKPTAVQTFALAFHELGARAMAQGAMATPAGRLRIWWEETTMRDGSPGFQLVWQEIGHGPDDLPADPRTFARDILERLTPRGLRGEVASTQTDEGFRWEVRFPATNVLPPRAG